MKCNRLCRILQRLVLVVCHSHDIAGLRLYHVLLKDAELRFHSIFYSVLFCVVHNYPVYTKFIQFTGIAK